MMVTVVSFIVFLFLFMNFLFLRENKRLIKHIFQNKIKNILYLDR